MKQKSSKEQLEKLMKETDRNILSASRTSSSTRSRYHQGANKNSSASELSKASIIAKNYGSSTSELSSLLAQVQGSLDGLRNEVHHAQSLSTRANGIEHRTPVANPSRPSSAPRMPRSMQESTPTATSILLRHQPQQQPILIPHSLMNAISSPSPSHLVAGHSPASRYQDNSYEAEAENESVSFAARSVRNEFDATAHVTRALDSKIDEFEKRIQVQLNKAVASATSHPPPSPAPPPPAPAPPVVVGPSESLVFLGINKAESAERSISELKAQVLTMDHQSSRKHEEMERSISILKDHQDGLHAKITQALTQVELIQASKAKQDEFLHSEIQKLGAQISETQAQISRELSRDVQSQVRELSSQISNIYAPRSELIAGLARIESLAQKHDESTRESGNQSRELLAASFAVTARADTLSSRIDGILTSIDQVQRQQHQLQLSLQQHQEVVQQVHHRQSVVEATSRSILPPVPVPAPSTPLNPKYEALIETLMTRIALLEAKEDVGSKQRTELEVELAKRVADERRISALVTKVSELEAALAATTTSLATFQSAPPPPPAAVKSRGVTFDFQPEASKAESVTVKGWLGEGQASLSSLPTSLNSLGQESSNVAYSKIKDLEDLLDKMGGAVESNVLSIRDMKDLVRKHDSRIVILEGGVTSLRQNSLSRIEVTANEARLAVVEDMCRDALNDIDGVRDKLGEELKEVRAALVNVQDKIQTLELNAQQPSPVVLPPSLDKKDVEGIVAASLIVHEARLNSSDQAAREALRGIEEVKADLGGLTASVSEQASVHKIALSGLELALVDIGNKVKDQGQDITVIRRELSTHSASIALVAEGSKTISPSPSPSPAPPSTSTMSRSAGPHTTLAASIAAVISGGDKGIPEQDISTTSSLEAPLEMMQPRTFTPQPSPLSFSPAPSALTSPLPEPQVPPPTSYVASQPGASQVRFTREFTPTPLCEEESEVIEEEEEDDDFALPPPPPPSQAPFQPTHLASQPSPMREARESLGLMMDNEEGAEVDEDGEDGQEVNFDDDDDDLLLPGQHEINKAPRDLHTAFEHDEETAAAVVEEEEEDRGSDFSLDISGEAEKLAFLLSSPAPSKTLPVLQDSRDIESPTMAAATSGGGGKAVEVAVVGSLDYVSSDEESVEDSDEAAAANKRAEAALAKAALTTAAGAKGVAKAYEDSDEEVEVFKPLKSLPPPPLVPKGRYHLTIITGSKTGAGMNNDLHLTLNGSMSNHQCQVNGREDGKIRFQKSSRDQVTIEAADELGAIQSISAWHQGEGFSSSWLLERIIIQHESSGQIWEFGINDWIRGGQGKDPKSYRYGARTPLAMSRENSASSLSRMMLPSPRVSADSVPGRSGATGRLSDSFDDEEDGLLGLGLGLGLPPKPKAGPPATKASGMAALFSQPPSGPSSAVKGLVATGSLSVPSVMGLVDDDDLADVEDALMLGGGGARSIPPPAPLVTQKGLPPLSSPREPSPHGKPPLPPPPGPLALPRSHSRASSQDRGSEGGALSDFGDTMDSLPGLGSGTGGGGGESKGVKVGKGTRRASNDSDSSLSSLGSLTGGRPVYGEVVDKNVRAAYGFDEEDEEEEEEHVRPATNYGGAISSTAGGMRVWDGKSVVSTTIEVESGPTLLSRGAAKGSLGGYKNPLAEGDED